MVWAVLCAGEGGGRPTSSPSSPPPASGFYLHSYSFLDGGERRFLFFVFHRARKGWPASLLARKETERVGRLCRYVINVLILKVLQVVSCWAEQMTARACSL